MQTIGQPGNAVDRLHRLSGIGMGIHGARECAVQINVYFPLRRVNFRDILDPGPLEGVFQEIAVRLGKMHVILIIAEVAPCAAVPGPGVTNAGIVVVDHEETAGRIYNIDRECLRQPGTELEGQLGYAGWLRGQVRGMDADRIPFERKILPFAQGSRPVGDADQRIAV
ncbi:hypothetical protein D3C81_1650050 [compost metagenome]